MEEKKIGEMKDLKLGKYVIINDAPCKVSSITHSKPGKHGGAKVRCEAIGIFDGTKRSLLGPVSQKIEIPLLDKRTAQVLTLVKDNVQLMDMESYETFELPIPNELKDQLKEGISILYMVCMGKKKILQLQ